MILMLMPVASHDKGHDVSAFDHLDLADGMVLLMILLASCNPDIYINGIHDKNITLCIVSVILI